MMPNREHLPVMKILLKHLAMGQLMTTRSLSLLTGISERNAKRYFDLAVKQEQAHVQSWTRHGARGRKVAVIAAGKGSSAPYPTV